MILLKFFQENRKGNITQAGIVWIPTEIDNNRYVLDITCNGHWKSCQTIPDFKKWINGFRDNI